MNVYLSDQDISQMPEPGRTWFLNWLPSFLKVKKGQSNSRAERQHGEQPNAVPDQLMLTLNRNHEENLSRSQVTLVQLFDAGILKAGMPVRVRLKRDLEKSSGRGYIDSFEISAKGTVFFNGQEFKKPSPLATKVNGSPVGGWEYIEVKKDGCWIRLEELREVWRKTSG